MLTDDEIAGIVEDYAAAARLAYACGYQFVDAKACHGYLGHEMLGATTRPGQYGGSLEHRLRFMTEIIGAMRSAAPGLGVVVRVSIFDVIPHRKGADGVGVPEPSTGGEPGFGLMRDEDMNRALDEDARC